VTHTQETADGVITLRPAGRHFRQAHAGAFREAIAALAAPAARVIVDLSGVERIDGPACGALLDGHEAVGRLGGELKLCSVPRAVRPHLHRAGVHRRVEVFNTREEALKSFEC
jgi:anti-anti-sigma factor